MNGEERDGQIDGGKEWLCLLGKKGREGGRGLQRDNFDALSLL